MKNRTLIYLSIGVLLMAILSFSIKGVYESKAEAEVKALILKAYINGAFNGLDPDAMRMGFHSDFAIFSADGEAISKYPIKTWADGVEKRKMTSEFDASKNKWEHKFAIVDVTGGSASAKIELFKDGKQVYTDYLSLLKFDSGWKIVAKVYHKHE